MTLFIVGMRRSGTTILYDALREDPALRCFYEPLREEAATPGGGSGVRKDDAFAETRALRERFRAEHFPEVPLDDFNWGGPREPLLELEPELPEHVRGFLRHLLEHDDEVAIKETRLHHKLAAIAELDAGASVIHLVRDPRAVAASMLLGRRRRRDLYPDAETFFTARTRRRLWSSRAISVPLLEAAGLPPDVPDFLRPLAVWKDAFASTYGHGRRLFGDRYLLLRLEDLRAEPAATLDRIYGLLGRELPPEVADWAAASLHRKDEIEHRDDPRWARAARLLGMEDQVTAAGYTDILALEPEGASPLDLEPPPPPSRISGMLRRARRRMSEG
jgi:Sulfotransferase family